MLLFLQHLQAWASASRLTFKSSASLQKLSWELTNLLLLALISVTSSARTLCGHNLRGLACVNMCSCVEHLREETQGQRLNMDRVSNGK